MAEHPNEKIPTVVADGVERDGAAPAVAGRAQSPRVLSAGAAADVTGLRPGSYLTPFSPRR